MKLGAAATEHVRILWDCRVNAFLLFQDAAPILTNELKGQLETQTAICLGFCLVFFFLKKGRGEEKTPQSSFYSNSIRHY